MWQPYSGVLSLTAPPVRGEDTTLLSAVAALIWLRDCPRSRKSQPGSTEDRHTAQVLRLGLHPSCLQAAWVDWGSEWGRQGRAPWSHICRYRQIFEIPRPQCSLRNTSEWPCHATHAAWPATLTETLSFGFYLAHPPLQLLCGLIFYLGPRPASQRDPAARDLHLGSQGRPAPAGDHSRLIMRPGASLAHSRAAHTHRLLGWGGRSTHLPPFSEMQRDLCHLPDTAIKSQPSQCSGRGSATHHADRMVAQQGLGLVAQVHGKGYEVRERPCWGCDQSCAACSGRGATRVRRARVSDRGRV
jgi:hypothetical protein